MHRTFVIVLVSIIQGCAGLPWRTLPVPDPPITILVGPVTLEAPVTSPSDLRTFEEDPSPDNAPRLLAQLIEEVELTGQRILTEHVARQPGFKAVPFTEARRLQTDRSSEITSLDAESLRALGRDAGVDVVLVARVVDYGVVRWQYWVPGLIVSMTAETLIAGAATGFNPAVMAATAASELLTDVPFWWGGAYVAGWALRPVRVKTEALDVRGCDESWTEEALVALVPGWTLRQFPPEERGRKEVQLTVNLTRALEEIADNAGQELRLTFCNRPA